MMVASEKDGSQAPIGVGAQLATAETDHSLSTIVSDGLPLLMKSRPRERIRYGK